MSVMIGLFLLLWRMDTLRAQPIHFQYTYSDSRQLPFDMGGWAIIQDTTGLIYWASVDGVYEFDGYRQKLYRLNNSNFSEPQPQFVLSLLLGANNEVWAGLRNGLARVDRQSGALSLAFNVDTKTSDFAFPLVQDPQGNIWVDCYDAIPRHGNMVKYNPATGRKSVFTLTHSDGSFFNEQINTLYFDELGMRIISASGSYTIRTIAPNKGVAEPIQWPGGRRNRHLKNLLAKDSTGYYWVVDSLGQLYRGKQLENLRAFTITPEPGKWPVKAVCIDKKNRAWVVGSKIAVYQPDKQQWQLIEPQGCTSDGFKGDFVYTVFHDRRNVHWIFSGISTAPASLQMLTEGSSNFYYWPTPGSNEKYVFPVYREPGGGELWLGFHSHGLARLDAHFNIKNTYTASGPAGQKLLSDRVIFMAPAGDDEMWFNCVPKGISILNKKTGQISDFKSPDGKAYQECFRLSDGRLLLAAYNQTSIYDPKTGVLRANTDIPEGNAGTATFRYVQCIEEEGDTLWMGGYDKHIHLLSLSTGALTTLQTDFIHHNIMALHRRGRQLFIGTLGQGLIIYDVLLKKATHQFMTPEGFPHHSVYGILEDKRGRLWLFTSSGLVLFEPEKLKFTEFGMLDGLPFEGFTSSGFFQDERGWMYGGFRGFVMFHPDSLVAGRPAYPAKAHISDLLIGGKSQPFSMGKTLVLAPDQNYIEVLFSNLDFGFPRTDTVWYKLDGFDEQWQFTTNNKAFFSRLPPGNYSLLLRGANRFGVKSEYISELDILIRPWWWQSKAFQLGFLLFWGIMIWLFARRYMNRKQQEAKRLRQQLVRKSLEALRSQLNHHFIKNTIGRSNAKILADDIKEANRFLGSLANLLEKMMFSARKDFYTLEEELEIMGVYLHIQRERWKKAFNYEIKTEVRIDVAAYFVPSLLTQPLIENAIEHGLLGKPDEPRLMWIDWRLQEQKLRCNIEDNGKGFEQEPDVSQNEHTGIQSVYSRIQLLNELYGLDIDMKIAYRQGGGTLVTILFPLIKKYPNL